MSDTAFIISIVLVLSLTLYAMYWLISMIPVYISIPIAVIIIGSILIYKVKRYINIRREY